MSVRILYEGSQMEVTPDTARDLIARDLAKLVSGVLPESAPPPQPPPPPTEAPQTSETEPEAKITNVPKDKKVGRKSGRNP